MRKLQHGMMIGLLLTGCMAPSAMKLLPAPELPAGKVRPNNVINRWTRETNRLRRFQTVIDAAAVYMCWNVRAALIADEINAKKLDPAAAAMLIERGRTLDKKYDEFILAVDSSNEEWSDLESDESPWRITLDRGDGGEMEPIQIESWEPKDLELWKYYEFISPWSKVYRIRFEKPGAAPNAPKHLVSALGLALRSVIGKADLRWSIETEE
ncbi:hypothetical protein JW905_06760 [bacterium]|nr:hypothetical protein [candidate division CSSED10-310 bacterium]